MLAIIAAFVAGFILGIACALIVACVFIAED